MTVNIKLFALLREKAGVGEFPVELRDQAVVADVREPLLRRFPALRDHISHCAYAVNRSYVRPDVTLNEGDEVALIPPVSGG